MNECEHVNKPAKCKTSNISLLTFLDQTFPKKNNYTYDFGPWDKVHRVQSQTFHFLF